MKTPGFLLGLLFLSAGITFPLQAQDTVSDFLLTAYEDRNLSGYDSQLDFIRPKNYRAPVIEELEFRWGNDEMTYEDLVYAARFSLGNPWFIRRNNAFFNATSREIRARKQVEFNENMYDRYDMVINYFYQAELSGLIDKRLDVISKISETFENNRESEFFDARDFVESKLSQIDNISNMEESLVETSTAKQKIAAILGKQDFDWEQFNFITVGTIDSIATLLFTESVSSAEIELIKQQLEVAAAEVAREKGDVNFGFLQLEYFPFTNRDSEYGISAGFTIPLFRNKPQIAERRLDQIELENKLIAEQFTDSLKNALEYVHLKSLIGHYRAIQKRVNELDMDAALSTVSRIENYDPIVILELEEGILELEEVLLKLRHKVTEQYLEFLFACDALTRQPLTNYLSNDFEPIE